MKSWHSLGLGLAVFIQSFQMRAAPGVGDPAPTLNAATLLQAPQDAKFDGESLKGKVVVLEFWATWCGPCILAIPHLNELAEKFKSQPVQFVAVTSEDEATVTPFLAKKPIDAWVALDTKKAMFNAYGVGGIPYTVVLAKDGTIAKVGFPESLTEDFLNNLLKGNVTITKPESVGHAVNSPAGSGGKAPLFELSIRPAAEGERMTGSSGGGALIYRAYPVSKLLPEAFEGASSATVWPETPLPDGNFDVTVQQPRGHSARDAHELLWQGLQNAFGLTASKATNEMNVYILSAGTGTGPGLTPASTKGGATRSGHGIIQAVNAPMDWLRWTLEEKLNVPVIDETGMKDRYDIMLKWEERTNAPDVTATNGLSFNPEDLTRAVQEQLGLKMVQARRPVAGFVVRKAD